MSRFACMVLLVLAAAMSAEADAQATCPVVKIEAVRLPDLNIPRVGHSVFVVNGEPTVVGGHTTSFVPTATAEYYSDGQWHLVPTAYPHDEGFSVPLRSGKVLVGGGHAEPLGIGHIYSVEMYDPVAHAFKGFGCLDTKRCFVSATEIDSGRVAISGNWYQDTDDIELFDGQKYFHSVKQTTQKRARPFVLCVAEDDAIVFGRADDRANSYDTIVVDRLKGEPFQVPLFDEWKPLPSLIECNSMNFLVADDGQGSYTYLIPVQNREGEIAVCRIAGTSFSLLPTKGSIPTTCEGRHINYFNCFNIDRQAGRAYLFGNGDNDGRLYVLAVDITKTPADLTLFYTEPVSNTIYGCGPVLTPDGDLLLTGGMELNPDSTVDNFTPHAAVLLLPVGQHPAEASVGGIGLWLWLVVAVAAIALLCILSYRYYRNYRHYSHYAKADGIPAVPSTPAPSLMLRLQQLMDEQKPYLNRELKLQDVADMLGTNRTYITDCIKSATGQSFTQYVNTCRVEQAKLLLARHPDMKMLAVAAESGFATESSFFRTFKAITGTTPNEWRAKRTETEA